MNRPVTDEARIGALSALEAGFVGRLEKRLRASGGLDWNPAREAPLVELAQEVLRLGMDLGTPETRARRAARACLLEQMRAWHGGPKRDSSDTVAAELRAILSEDAPN